MDRLLSFICPFSYPCNLRRCLSIIPTHNALTFHTPSPHRNSKSLGLDPSCLCDTTYCPHHHPPATTILFSVTPPRYYATSSTPIPFPIFQITRSLRYFIKTFLSPVRTYFLQNIPLNLYFPSPIALLLSLHLSHTFATIAVVLSPAASRECECIASA